MKTKVLNDFFKVLYTEETGDVLVLKRDIDLGDETKFLVDMKFMIGEDLATLEFDYNTEEGRDGTYWDEGDIMNMVKATIKELDLEND